jgi:hydroxymethylbilane synthase
VAIGTRASALALAQAYLVQAALASLESSSHFHVTPMSTAGDKNQSTALYLLGGKSYWTKELEVALLEGAIDLIVHSLKDVPTSLPDGLELGAILEREDPRDCLVIKANSPHRSLKDLPEGAVVGTSSVRRVAQLRRAYPKLLFADVVRCA